MIVIGIDLLEGFVDELLGSVFDVVGTVDDWVFDVVPVSTVFAEAVDFVMNASGFD